MNGIFPCIFREFVAQAVVKIASQHEHPLEAIYEAVATFRRGFTVLGDERHRA